MAHDGGSATAAQQGERTTSGGPDERGHRRRPSKRGTISVVGALIVAILAGAGAWLAYAAHYQPLGPGSTAGPRAPAVATSDGLGETAYLITGRHGVVVYSVSNDGGHPVRVLGLAPIEGATRVSVAWAPVFTPGGPLGGRPSQVRPFPVTVRPGHQIALWVTVTRSRRCVSGIDDFVDDLPLRWSALGFHHMFHLRLGTDVEGNGELPIFTCYPAKALRHARLGW